MATPFGHSLAGYAIYSSTASARNSPNRLYMALLCLVVAMVPDLDLIPGILIGKPVFYHGSITHSLGFALVVSLGIAGIYHFKERSFPVVFKLCFLAYFSHLVLDFLGPDGRPPYGIPLFWPLSQAYFIAPVPILLGAHHVAATSASTSEFIGGILNFYNLAAIALEAFLILPFVFLGKQNRTRKQLKNFVRRIGPQLEERKA